MMKKRIIGVLLILTLVLSTGSMAFGAVSVPLDVKGGQYEPAVSTLMEMGLLTGYPDGTFRPDAKVTRAEACTMVVKLKADEETIAETPANKTLTDTQNSWAAKYIDYAVAGGIVNGYAGGVFRPENQVTYEEMAAILINAMGYSKDDLVGVWPANYVNKAKELGVFKGLEENKIGEIPATRGDVARMVYYAAELDKERSSDKILNGKLNQTMSTAFFDFTVTSVKSVSVLDGISLSKAGNTFIVADVTVKNTGEEEIPVGNYDFIIQWENGGKTESGEAYPVFKSLAEGMYPDKANLAPGGTLTGKLVFEVPKDQKKLAVVYREIYEDNFVGDSYIVELELK